MGSFFKNEALNTPLFSTQNHSLFLQSRYIQAIPFFRTFGTVLRNMQKVAGQALNPVFRR
jgi:hypothetical protein